MRRFITVLVFCVTLFHVGTYGQIDMEDPSVNLDIGNSPLESSTDNKKSTPSESSTVDKRSTLSNENQPSIQDFGSKCESCNNYCTPACLKVCSSACTK